MLTFPLALSPPSFEGDRSLLFGRENRRHAGPLREAVVYLRRLRSEPGRALTGSPHLWEQASAALAAASQPVFVNTAVLGHGRAPPFTVVSAALLGPVCGPHTLFFTLWLFKERVLTPALRSISGENCNCLNVTFSGNSLNMS